MLQSQFPTAFMAEDNTQPHDGSSPTFDLTLLTPAEREWYKLFTSGFGPTRTSGRSNLCGLHALKISLLALLSDSFPDFAIPEVLAGPDTDVSQLVGVINSPRYRYHQRLKVQLPFRGATEDHDPGWSKDERKELRRLHYSGTGEKLYVKDLRFLVWFLNFIMVDHDGNPGTIFPVPFELCPTTFTPRNPKLRVHVSAETLRNGTQPVWIHHTGLKIGCFNEGHWEGVAKVRSGDGIGMRHWKSHLKRLNSFLSG